ncbi:potassium channel, putative [Talaromyces stipitatus ATCC 10500]|uniref:Potassium channel, putative n=1 Tax=Talaromyces stipitatus (strain ATCC 10500 / CBS 375.48 / QM 6759 / NRRL 1006) TaxID=441959 RepID=B8MAC6_TALSN|nr:potassium channel, putative [Talaromyces stipitatus ATCC 10500]EED18628.1 potassium channel, putative [Talaromyces stipitatus ATCC 10500]
MEDVPEAREMGRGWQAASIIDKRTLDNMNDPGLDPAITETANEVEHRAQDGSKQPDERYVHWTSADRELEQFLQPTRWWYASNEIPLVAATFGPMANAFSVCSLSQKWREIVTDGEPPYAGQPLGDPEWEVAINAVSLAAALFANICLLLTMARRMSFNMALPIVIVGWYIASVLLIISLSIVGRDTQSAKNAGRGMQMTEAYYYGSIAAGLYFIIASLLIITVYGAMKGHYSRKFHLSQSQRTLMIQNIGFLVYVLAGSAVYSYIEGWRFNDAVWWSDFTILTIGIGYPSPSTHLGRSLLFPYAFGGILIIGVVIGSIRSLVLERGKSKMSSRLLEKTRKTFSNAMTTSGNKDQGVLKIFPVVEDGAEMDEEERAKREFFAMRKVRHLAHTERRWLSLLISATAVGILWFVGALIFQHAEATQQWTYFEALYYTYTSLLTIGYGDVYTISNWGRAFFVFWSLLAVPAMTMFISNLGDTFIRQFKNFANFIGELTFLPGDMGYRERFKQFFNAELWPFTFNKPKLKNPSGNRNLNDSTNATIERAESALEEEQLREEHEAHRQGDVIAENIHHHQYLLMRELREMFKWVNASPPKEFDYNEWVYFLKLLEENKCVKDLKHANHGQDQSEETKWSWISHRSPLLGDKSEAEWLLEALADKLERELLKLSDEYRQREDGKSYDDKSGEDDNRQNGKQCI